MPEDKASKEPRVPVTCYAPLSHAVALRCPVLGSFQGQMAGHLHVWGLGGLGQILRSPE